MTELNSDTNTSEANNTPIENHRDAEILKLREELNEARAQLNDQRLQTTIAKAGAARSDTVNNAQQELRREQAIQACHGLAKWYSLDVATRVRTINDGVYVDIPAKKLEALFGREANGSEVQRVRREDPAFYRAARALWLETRK
jgi:hypothetical protein